MHLDEALLAPLRERYGEPAVLPWNAYVIVPTAAVMPIAASDVAAAGRTSNAAATSSSGTITIPPPTPKSALKNPATRPMSTRRTGLC